MKFNIIKASQRKMGRQCEEAILVLDKKLAQFESLK